MADPATNSDARAAMVAETMALGAAIAERLSSAERFVTLAGAATGVGLTLGLYEKQEAVLVGLPLVVAITLIYVLQIYTDASMLSGHRLALEEHLDQLFGRPTIVIARVTKDHDSRLSVRLVTIPMLLLLFITGAVGFTVSGRLQYGWLTGGWLRIFASAAYAVVLCILLRAAFENLVAAKKAHDKTCRLLAP